MLEGVQASIPQVLGVTSGIELVKLVDSKIKELLDCLLPFENVGTISLYMCPAKHNCGKSGS
jgi:hypothetical protein